MITYDVDQGMMEWMRLRVGIPTMSQADRLLTAKTRKPSASRHRYRAELIAEWLLGQPMDWGSSTWMDRGTEQEAEARQWYELERDVEVDTAGFITTDDGQAGGSPDGLVGTDGIIEIKVPAAHNHVLYMLGEEPDYVGQCQGYMWLTGRQWCDFVSYNTDLPPVIHRVLPDPEWVEKFVPILTDFAESMREARSRLAEHRMARPWDDQELPEGVKR